MQKIFTKFTTKLKYQLMSIHKLAFGLINRLTNDSQMGSYKSILLIKLKINVLALAASILLSVKISSPSINQLTARNYCSTD